MSMAHVLAIAVALAMDAFAVAIAAGVTLKTVSFRQTFRLSWHFGFFQAMMPVLGWGAGLSFRPLIERYCHWVAFGLLTYVGLNMIKAALSTKDEAAQPKDPTRGITMVMLSVATSIDALAVGLSLSLLHISIWTPAVIIGAVAGLFTIVGMHLGKKIGALPRLRRLAETLGGAVLLIIGFKILYENGVFALFK